MEVFIKGKQYKVLDESIDISLAVEERSTASFVVRDLRENLMFQKGETVEIKHGELLLFAGLIERVHKYPITMVGGYFFQISCVDYHYFADKRIIAESYRNTDTGSIARDIYYKYLQPEGIKLGMYGPGEPVDEAVFNYVTAAEALTKLSNYADGYTWYIDNQKYFYYMEKGVISAPYCVEPNNTRVSNANYEESASFYRNRQYIKGATDVTTTQEEIKVGDGAERVFITRYPLNNKPQIFVSYDGSDWVEKTVGIKDLEDERDFYWSKGSNEIIQADRLKESDEETIPALSSNDRVKIVYIGQFDTVIITQLPYEIERLKNVEGSTGIVEAIEDVTGFSTRNDTLHYANALLNKYGQISKSIVFDTVESGLAPGQSVNVTLPIYGVIDESMVIESIEITSEAQRPLYKVQAVKGPMHGSWETLFNNIVQLGNKKGKENLVETQQIVIPFEFSKRWTWAEEPNIFKRTSNLPTYAGFYAGMTYKDRVKYMSWFRDGIEIGRVPATQITETDADIIYTLFHLHTNQANVRITELVWWGGASATEELGTGFIVDRQPFDRRKNNREVYQISRFDYRWPEE